MTALSAHRHAHHAARVQGLYDYAYWVERDLTTPLSDYLPDVAPVESTQQLAEYAAIRQMDGPHEAPDGSWFLHRAFPGGVSYQAVCWANHAGASPDEQKARAWAALHGCVIVPLADLFSGSPS